MVIEIGARNPYDICDIVDIRGEYLRITRREYIRRKMQGDRTLKGCRPSFQPESFRSEIMRKYGKKVEQKFLGSILTVAEFLL